MQKINFQNLPSTTTPINATNLNAIQSNAETAINDVAGDLSDYVDGTTAMGDIKASSVTTTGNATIGGNVNCSDVYINSLKNSKLIVSDTLTNGQSKTYTLSNASAIFLIFVTANGNNTGGLEMAYYNGTYHTTIKAPSYVTFSYSNGSVAVTSQYTNKINIIELT